MKDYLILALAALGFCALVVFMVIYGTSDKVWYAGKHDSKCETAGYGDCGCYDRFMKKGN